MRALICQLLFFFVIFVTGRVQTLNSVVELQIYWTLGGANSEAELLSSSVWGRASGLDKLHAQCWWGMLGCAKSLRDVWFFGRTCFAFKRKIPFNLQIFCWIYYEQHFTCNILVMFTCLRASKLLYLPMDFETTVSKQPALEQVRGVIWTLQTSKMELFSK